MKDNQTIVITCAPHVSNILAEEVKALGYPFGKQVKLRLLDLDTKEVSDLTEEFYGGQGTINVPSWNPEGTQFAYVRYAVEDI